MIINKELVVSNRKKADIVEELRQKKFRPFPKVAKAKTTAEGEDAEDNDEAEEAGAASGASTDYDYLLSMPIWSLTKEKVRNALAYECVSSPSVVAHAFVFPHRSRSSFSKRPIRRRSC
jgi:DNA topoisomerase-2